MGVSGRWGERGCHPELSSSGKERTDWPRGANGGPGGLTWPESGRASEGARWGREGAVEKLWKHPTKTCG